MSGKEAKERHVTGHTGSTIYEIQLILVVILYAYLLNKLFYRSFPLRGFKQYASEFIILVVPFVLSTTFAHWTMYIITAQLSLIVLFYVRLPQSSNPPKPQRHEPFIVAFRGYLQLLTISAILAVDFHVFPRRFAKTETFGTSLMDVGVGAFIFSSGIVAGPKLINNQSSDFIKTLKQLIPCLVLGFGRAVFTKLLDYQEHVTEYGVHWNFFVTLSLLPILVSIQSALIPKMPIILVALGCYQYVLSNYGLENYILHGPRIDLISMNREGIYSLLGYYSIFLIAASLGSELLTLAWDDKLQRNRFFVIFKYLVCTSIGLYISIANDWKVSRRMANLPYTMWSSWVCVGFLAGFFIIDTFIAPFNHTPVIFASVNRNQLAIFLLANVFTGLTINFEELFENFRIELLSLFLYNSQVNAIALYQMTFDCCTSLPEPRSEMLLKAIVEFLTEHAVGIIDNSKNLLEGYSEQWEKYNAAAIHMDRACDYLNKQLLHKSNPYKNTLTEQLLRLPILAHAHIIWQAKILVELNLNHSNLLVDKILYQIQENRNGSEINDRVVKSCINSFIEINKHSDTPIALYMQEFEEVYLKSAVSYYSAESTNLIQSLDISLFIERALGRFDEESRRSGRYLHESSFEKVLDAFKEGYIINHFQRILDEFTLMIQSEDETKSLLAYRIVSKIPDGIRVPVEVFEAHITKVLVDFTHDNSKDPFAFLDQILTFHAKFLRFVQHSFQGEHEFEAAMDKAFRFLINSSNAAPNIHFPEIISKYFDHMLKKSSKVHLSEQELEAKLFKLTKLFVYIDEKDLFQKFYMRSLAKRLLYNTSTSNDIELSMISKLKEACGFEFTSKMQRMFTDVTLSDEINVEFKKVHSENDFHVLVLTTGSWPIPADTFDGYRLPIEVATV
ncbi:Cullin-2 [Terramyces sp. JEL0728]|nr:Cullin-2 [Terramyces sp. JEL0728]